ncbi:Reverse transcriptase (RNA-dependent DNA polymerase) [Fragilaria crotonensis]|nr:Reverse transcriptase (RNA-dependent DNA polymerase) [Fragilaria crotonensis]
MTAWPTWIELFMTYLAQQRSVVAGTPLVYVIRDNDEAAPDDLARNNWDSVDDDLIATSVLEGETFSRDNKRVFDILKPFVMEGQGWPFLQTFNKKRDGRAAFKALKSQAEGKSAIATRKAKAYNMLATATYTGKGKFSFDQYVTDFLAGIRDPKLETAIQGCMGDELKLTNFEVCQQYFKTIVENTKTRTKSPSDVREISKVGVEKDKKKAKHKKDKSKSNEDDKTPSGIAIHSGQYSAKDYNKLKPFEKAKVKQLREEAKKKEKKDKSDARSVAVVATQEEAPPDDNEGTKTPVVSNAGKQFGRAAHDTRTELDSHADTCVAGRNTLLVSDEGRQVTVHPYSGEYKPIPDVSIATVATLWIHPTDGQPYILIINEALYFGDRVDVTLLNPNQLRANGVTVEDVPASLIPSLRIQFITQPQSCEFLYPLTASLPVS